MQEARDVVPHRPRPCPCHSLPVVWSPFPSEANTTIADRLAGLLAAGGNPYAVRVGADSVRDRMAEPLPGIDLARSGDIVVLPVHAFPKRSDGWKNVRNSSLSITEGVE
jgi:hypothetical protein